MNPDDLLCSGKYRLIRAIGHGGYGEVWLAEEALSQAPVALKFAHMNVADAVQRFQREIRISLNPRLEYSRLLTAKTFEREGELPFLVLPFMLGGSVRQRLARDRQLPVDVALNIARQTAEALARLHDEDIIHRDVHPGNILFTSGDQVKLADLGLAQTTVDSTSLWYRSNRSRHPGNIQYQPPEATATNGVLMPLLPASDVYMLGAVLWEMLTGRLYYNQHGINANSLRPEVPDWLDNLLTSALAEDIARRPQDGQGFAELLARAEGQWHLVSEVRETGTPARQGEQPAPIVPGPSAPIVMMPASPQAGPAARLGPIECVPTPDNPAGIVWVDIPAGDFLYGDEKQRVTIPKPYQIGKFPVTNAQYQRFLTANPKQPVPSDWDNTRRSYPTDKGDHPVVSVSRNDAQAFCQWAKCRLPTEEEWEKAARGTDGRVYPWGNEPPDTNRCNFNNNVKAITPAAQYSPKGDSAYGCVDMSGNVTEWTASKSLPYGYVVRSGSWSYLAQNVRAAYRFWGDPGVRYNDTGFRCAR
jgi:serine/threonine protein kinase